MKPHDLFTALEAEILLGEGPHEVENAYTGDLLSDVIANAPDKSVLITIQAHLNAVAVASMAGAAAILVCNNRPIPDDMLESAKKEGIAVARTTRDQFRSSHLVYRVLNEHGHLQD